MGYIADMSLIANERTKLTANWLNAMASGIIVTGAIAPAIAAVLGVTSVAGWIIALSSCVWLFSGLALHFVARRILGRLEP
ncbi:hypothetical protein [Aureimonas sp. D3]|uniref:hypothetical protein n=1 Tax=Aureimonas sp. D3 TaxID=1638164 RepID=UPI000A5FB261|nr:hypothetical protein [Aureimonas sp. D3]